MRLNLLACAVLPVLLAACAQMPDTTMTRHQIDDLRDSDKDGVINQRDICADTPLGAEVDSKGCTRWTIYQKVDIKTVYFNFDDAHIRLDQSSEFDELLALLNQGTEAKVILVGDTSPEGSDEYNQVLAKKRTSVLKEALIENGIAPERISEQEFTQETALTEKLKDRKRRTIAVITQPDMKTEAKWTIYTSEQESSNLKRTVRQ
ncbi:TPA: OmpA family protein [Vibrio vulnificus]